MSRPNTAEYDLEDIAWWMSFGVHPRRIADHLRVSPAWLITKARRAGWDELADRIRDRCRDDGDNIPHPITGCGINNGSRNFRRAATGAAGR